MFLFILESIGTPELILIAVVALIVLGPRKLPQMAKTIGKTMAEFRNATSEFKNTWEKEIAYEEEIVPGVRASSSTVEPFESDKTISREPSNQLPAPQIKELSSQDIAENFPKTEMPSNANESPEIKPEPKVSEKRDWL